MTSSAAIFGAAILIVDDRASNIVMLDQLLRQSGYRNLHATTDPYAVCALHQQHRFDLILLDLQMPGMDGFAVMAQLQAVDAPGYAPILAITVEPQHRLRALGSGAKDFICKPFDNLELTTRIYNMVEVRLLYKRLEQSVRDMESVALHDELTGLPNRRLLMDRLRQARLASERSGQFDALMFLDLDNFKQLNDTRGHDVGDLLLQQVAARLHACLREGDSVSRLGGDEFVVLLEALSMQDHEAANQARLVAQKMQSALQQPYLLKGVVHECSASIGIAMFRGEKPAQEELLKMADIAMYQAKAAGRNRACFFDPAMQAAVAAQDALSKDLRRGIAAQELCLHFQLQVNAAGQPFGAEALVRWRHPERGLMLPGEFVSLAEETGQIVALGQWVISAACAQLALWAAQPQCAHWALAVNVSAAQFAYPGFVEHVLLALQTSGASPRLLKLELTESTLIVDVELVIARMQLLKAAGLGFALDDFGTGYSSLNYLRRLPLEQLKMDHSFVQHMLSDPSAAVIARAIVALGNSLGMQVIAEGVESAAQRDFLNDIGCHSFQGFLFGQPVPAPQLVAPPLY